MGNKRRNRYYDTSNAWILLKNVTFEVKKSILSTKYNIHASLSKRNTQIP